jgi:hypothetical protein
MNWNYFGLDELESLWTRGIGYICSEDICPDDNCPEDFALR